MSRPPKTRPATEAVEALGPGIAALMERVLAILDGKRAEEIVALDVSAVTDLADVFVIATILNPRQGATIVEECEKARKEMGLSCLGIEGGQGSSWVLLDYGDLIVHLFMPEQRAYYALESLWADAKRLP